MFFVICSAEPLLEKSRSYTCALVIHVHICFNMSCIVLSSLF